MNSDFTHITMILDRSGSMASIRDDTIGGFNTFLKSQQEAPGKATLTLIQFDTRDPYEIIHLFRPLKQIPELTRTRPIPARPIPARPIPARPIRARTPTPTSRRSRPTT